jgi:hypothetical protein
MGRGSRKEKKKVKVCLDINRPSHGRTYLGVSSKRHRQFDSPMPPRLRATLAQEALQMNWRRATLIAALANFTLFLIALTVEEGAWRAAWEAPSFTFLFSVCPQIGSVAVVYAASAWLSRSKVASPVLAPIALVLLGAFFYGLVIFGGPPHPDTAEQMAVFFTGPVECIILTLAFAVAWLAAQWIGRLRRRLGPTP